MEVSAFLEQPARPVLCTLPEGGNRPDFQQDGSFVCFLNWVRMELCSLSSGVWLLSLNKNDVVKVLMLVQGAVCAFPSPSVQLCGYTTHYLFVPLLMRI